MGHLILLFLLFIYVALCGALAFSLVMFSYWLFVLLPRRMKWNEVPERQMELITNAIVVVGTALVVIGVAKVIVG